MIDIYNTETMIAGLQLLPPKPVFLRNRYFPSDDTTIFATEDVLVDIKDEYQRKMAPCVIERKGGIMVGREGYKTDRIKPANVAPKRALTIDNIRKRQFGETLFSRRKPEEREAAILRQDLVELSDMIDQREEYMASKVLFENGYTMRHYADEYGGDKYEEFEVHFYEEDQNPSVYVPAAAWNAADDKWYQDLTAMVRSLKRRGVPVTDVLIGSSVANELMKNDFLLKMLDNRRVEIGRIEPTELAAGATSYGRIIVDGTALELLSYSLQYLDEDGISHTEYTVADSNDIASVVQSAVSEVDVIYIPTDNTMAGNTEAVDNITRPAGIPVIAGEEGICSGCGVATLSISYYDIGYKAGEMAYDILVNGKDISTMDIEYAPNVTKEYNAAICSDLGITVPDDYVAIDAE
jgi:hypothetical protein